MGCRSQRCCARRVVGSCMGPGRCLPLDGGCVRRKASRSTKEFPRVFCLVRDKHPHCLNVVSVSHRARSGSPVPVVTVVSPTGSSVSTSTHRYCPDLCFSPGFPFASNRSRRPTCVDERSGCAPVGAGVGASPSPVPCAHIADRVVVGHPSEVGEAGRMRGCSTLLYCRALCPAGGRSVSPGDLSRDSKRRTVDCVAGTGREARDRAVPDIRKVTRQFLRGVSEADHSAVWPLRRECDVVGRRGNPWVGKWRRYRPWPVSAVTEWFHSPSDSFPGSIKPSIIVEWRASFPSLCIAHCRAIAIPRPSSCELMSVKGGYAQFHLPGSCGLWSISAALPPVVADLLSDRWFFGAVLTGLRSTVSGKHVVMGITDECAH